MSEWKTMDSAPKDGRDILICTPTGSSDHYYPVCWAEPDGDDEELTEPAWQCRWQTDMILTEDFLSHCYLQPMWRELDRPPSSMCEQSIVNRSYVERSSIKPDADQ